MVLPVNQIAQRVVATIPSGDALSDRVHLAGRTFVGLYMPAGWTTADLTFDASFDDTNWYPVKNEDGTDYTVAVAAGVYVGFINAVPMFGAHYLRVRSGSPGALQVQGAEREISLMLAAIN